MKIAEIVQRKASTPGFEYWFEEHRNHADWLGMTGRYMLRMNKKDPHPLCYTYWIVCCCGKTLFCWDLKEPIIEKLPEGRPDPARLANPALLTSQQSEMADHLL